MPETLRIRECSGLECGGVDAALPVIRRVKILGWESKNRRQYLRESVQPNEYAEKVINLNHPDGPNKQRQVQDRFGWFEAVTKDDSGVWGDLHYNPKHPYAEQFAWLAANKPSLVGLSHDAVGTGRTNKDGVFIVEKVIEVKSVDLVADPATTKGLFESMEPQLDTPAAGADEKSVAQQIGELIVQICKDEQDPKVKKKKILKALKLFDEPEAEEEEGGEVEEAEGDEAESAEDEDEEGKKRTEESVKAKKLAKENKELRERLDALEAKDRLNEKHKTAHRLCEEAKLPAVLVSETFLTLLVEAKDEAAMKKLIEDRRSISNIKRPVSTGPASGKGGLDNKSFAQALIK